MTQTIARPAHTTPATKTVLVVEDDDAVRRITARSLRAAGYDVLEAADAPGAIRAAARPAAIDLVVSYVVMPGPGGPELARQLRSGRPGLRVLLVSGYPEGVLAGSIDLGGGARFLPKPYTPSELAGEVRAILARV